jgi:D-tyrosyl-tRNA(Tyr) deacylase
LKVLIQRILGASVVVDDKTIGEVDAGLLIFLGISVDDVERYAMELARKCAKLRIFDDSEGKMNLSLLDVNGDALVVSQFTLCADASKGRRPSYTNAARPEQAIPLYEKFICELRRCGVKRVETGRFGADMKVSLINDGPVTLMLDYPCVAPEA